MVGEHWTEEQRISYCKNVLIVCTSLGLLFAALVLCVAATSGPRNNPDAVTVE